MEKIVVNNQAKENEVTVQVATALQRIQTNAEKGINTTDLYVPKFIASDVRSKITELLKESGTNFDWLVVRRGINEYTGRAEYFTSETIGDEKHFKIKVF